MPTGPNDRNDWTARDRWNATMVKWMSPVMAWSLLALVGLATFYVQTSFSEVKKNAALVSQESKETAKETAVLKEAVGTIKTDVQEIKAGQRATGEKLDRILEQMRRPR